MPALTRHLDCTAIPSCMRQVNAPVHGAMRLRQGPFLATNAPVQLRLRGLHLRLLPPNRVPYSCGRLLCPCTLSCSTEALAHRIAMGGFETYARLGAPADQRADQFLHRHPGPINEEQRIRLER